MVLSNKKLKQKMRAAKAQMIIDSQKGPVESLSNMKDLEGQKPKVSKREKRRQKTKLNDSVLIGQIGVDGDLKEINVAEMMPLNDKKKKRKRDETNASENGKVQEPKILKKKAKIKGKKKKKKDVNNQIQKETGNENGPISEEQLVLSLSAGDSRKEEEPSTKVYVGGIPYYSTEDDIRSYFESCGTITHVDCMTFQDSGKFRGIAIITFKTEAATKRALAFDGSDMGGLFLKVQPFNSAKTNKTSNFSPTAMEGYYRIYVGNLAWNITEKDLRKIFSDCKIASIRFGEDKETGDFKGYAHIDFANDVSFNMALKLDQTVACGRPLRISCAVPKNGVVSKDNQADANKGIQDQTISEYKNSGVNEDQENWEEGNTVSSKIRRRTCYECGEKGHLSSSCPKQKNVEANGNKVIDVHEYPINSEDKNSTVAKDQENSKEGSPVSSKIRRRTCYECGEKGHLSSSCPKQKNVEANGNKVIDVHEYPINSEDKNSTVAKDQENSKEGSPVSSKIRRRTCYVCGEKGHLSSSCPNQERLTNGNKDIDVQKDQINSEDKISVVTKDQENYEEENPASSKIRRRKCYECGEKGHLSSSCPKKQTEDLKSVPTA